MYVLCSPTPIQMSLRSESWRWLVSGVVWSLLSVPRVAIAQEIIPISVFMFVSGVIVVHERCAVDVFRFEKQTVRNF